MLEKLIFAALAAVLPMNAQEPIRYLLRFPAPETHYLEVEAEAPTAGKASVEMLMAAWTPGSYLIREYSQHVEDVRAARLDGERLAVEKTAKNRWRVETAGAGAVRFSYRVYCREMSVRSNWVERDFAILNGAPTFITLADESGSPARIPHEVRLELPEGWPRAHTGLRRGAEPNHYVAPDFDTIVDSPILAGGLAIYGFDIEGVKHYLVNLGEEGVWDGPRSARDTETIARAQIEFWGSIPYEEYSFLNAITEAGGGLEHMNSTLLMTRRWATRKREDYLRWLGLVSHEFFHAWNVKRLRPRELGPFDYEQEAYTESLWVAEGVTSYYDSLFVRRAGLSSRKEYLEALSKDIDSVQRTPGREAQSLSESSYDTWIKLYRPNESRVNNTISYYTKGAVVSFLLDARIRELTAGEKSLDDAMRAAYERYSGERGYTQEEFRMIVSETAGADLSVFFADYADGTADLDYSRALGYYGLRFKPAAGDESKEPKAYLGLVSAVRDNRLVVTQVPRGTPAFEAGLNVDDEILAIDDFRVPPDRLDARLERYRPGDRLEVLIARRDRVMRLPLTAGETPPKRELEIDPDATDEQRQRLDLWLGPEADPS